MSRHRWTPIWAGLLVALVASIGAGEALLLELGRTFFSGGYNGRYIDTLPLIAAFFSLGAIIDGALVLGIWSLTLPWLKRLPGTPLQHWVLSGSIAAGIPFAMDFAKYRLQTVLGDMVSIRSLWEVSTGSVTEVASGTSSELGHLAFAFALAALTTGALVLVIGRFERRGGFARFAGSPERLSPPSTWALWLSFLTLAGLSAVILLFVESFLPQVSFGITRKPSARVVSEVIWRATDFDRDGFGLLSRPADPAAFDASIHPYALDVPGNGIDENGIAGDHPAGVQPLEPTVAPAISGPRRPHFLLVYLESFRGDLLGQRFGNRELTPFLNRLAREGASSDRAFVHSPSTAVSRGQLFGGRLDPYSGQSSLVDDFKGLGYTVALISGQDDTYGDGIGVMGAERADYFYDAREDRDRRTSRSTSPAGLQVSWKLVLERTTRFLETHDPDEPLFLYVNIVDTHHPYHHAELDDILGIEPVSANEMSVDDAERVRETYYNCVANVDRAVERLVTTWRSHLGERDRALLLTADHAQALFDEGFLGHGQGLTAEQTRVPLIVHGVGGVWPEPIGAAELRGLLRRHLFAPRRDGQTERFETISGPRFFQVMPSLDRPRILGVRSQDGAVIYNFRTSRVSIHRGESDERLALPRKARRDALRELIWMWEAHNLRLDAAGPEAPPVYE